MSSAPSPPTGERADSPPMITGATKPTTLSTSPASNSEPRSVPPPSTNTLVMSRRPSSSMSPLRSTRPSFAGVRNTSAPAASSRTRSSRHSRAAATSVLPGCCSSVESLGKRPLLSTTTRNGWRGRGDPSVVRAVSCGLSAITVPMPAMIASDRALSS